jgi:hypothetical protein
MSNPNASFQERQNEARLRQQQNQTLLNKMRQQSLSRMGVNKKSQSMRAADSMGRSPDRITDGAATPSRALLTGRDVVIGTAVGAAALVVRDYTQNVGLFTGNQAAQNRISNSLQRGSRIGNVIGAGVAAAKFTGGNPYAIAIAAAGALATQAVRDALEAKKLAFKIDERRAQGAKDSQRLGQVIVNRGR